MDNRDIEKFKCKFPMKLSEQRDFRGLRIVEHVPYP